ncbi:MAG: pilus assembly protein CpaD [Caulobacteraceae bacterium]|nr:pilus assembly protein CpaD [Caulobacteraceae bacterium]
MTRILRNTVLALAPLALSASLAACMGAPAGGVGLEPLNPATRYTLQVEPGVDRIALAVHETGLSGAQQSALVDLANRFGLQGATVLRIEAPSGDDPVSAEFAYRVKAALESMGAPEGAVQVVGYAAPDPRAPVVVGFETLRAAVPQCGTYWGNMTRTNGNDTSANFGCAVTANLAAQIDNPRDIVTPRGMTPVDTGRRAVVYDNYRKGEATAAPQEELVANRRVSQAVN